MITIQLPDAYMARISYEPLDELDEVLLLMQEEEADDEIGEYTQEFSDEEGAEWSLYGNY